MNRGVAGDPPAPQLSAPEVHSAGKCSVVCFMGSDVRGDQHCDGGDEHEHSDGSLLGLCGHLGHHGGNSCVRAYSWLKVVPVTPA